MGDVGQGRFEKFMAAARGPCVCQGRWVQHVLGSLRLNLIDIPDLCHSVMESLRVGRSESQKVVTLVGRHGGEGKSLFFQPLLPLYGVEHVQLRPGGGQFPLMGIETKRVALLDEWRFVDSSLPIPLQLLWLEGKPVPINRPQNQAGYSGHALYRGTAPVFIAAPEDGLDGLASLGAEQPRGEASMLLRRLRIFSFARVMAPPPPPRIVPCPRCFALLVATQAAQRQT